jgi:carbamoyl-phosphate synthase small subunit
LPLLHSNWRATESLQSFLLRCKVVAIADIDTRKLTRLLRDKGAQSGCIMTGENIDQSAAVRAAKKFPGLKGMDLAKAVSTKKIYQWNDGLIWKTAAKPPRPQSRLHVVAYDYGMKRSILRILAEHGCRMTVVPAQTPADQVLAMNPDGIFLSNGPGDPEPCDYAIQAIAKFLETDIPVFGICLGHQLLGLASGAKTIKMKFGHHGANHPVLEIDSGRVLISSQNHGFAVDEATLPDTLRPTHRSLFDGSLQGVSRTDRPAFSFQGHPEASPGPHDLRLLFEHFMYLMVKRVQANSRGRTPVKQKSAEG